MPQATDIPRRVRMVSPVFSDPHKGDHGLAAFVEVAQIAGAGRFANERGDGGSLLSSAGAKGFPQVIVEIKLGPVHDVYYTSSILYLPVAYSDRPYSGNRLVVTGPLHSHQLHGLCGDLLCGNFEFLDQFPGGAGVSEAIFNTDGAGDDGHAVESRRLRDDAGDWPCQSADLVLFCGQHDTGVAGGADDGLIVERLQSVQVEDAGLIPEILFEDVGRAHSLGDHGATGDDGEVF